MAVAQASLISGISRWWTLFPLSCRNRIQYQRHVHFIDLAWILISHILKIRTMNPNVLYVIQHNSITFQTVEWITKMSHTVKPMYQQVLLYVFPMDSSFNLKGKSCVLHLHLIYTNKTQEREVDELVCYRELLIDRRLSRIKEVSYSIRTPESLCEVGVDIICRWEH